MLIWIEHADPGSELVRYCWL